MMSHPRLLYAWPCIESWGSLSSGEGDLSKLCRQNLSDSSKVEKLVGLKGKGLQENLLQEKAWILRGPSPWTLADRSTRQTYTTSALITALIFGNELNT